MRTESYCHFAFASLVLVSGCALLWFHRVETATITPILGLVIGHYLGRSSALAEVQNGVK